MPIGTAFVYAILVLYASACRKPNLDAAFLLIFRYKKVELQLHYKRGITLLTCNFLRIWELSQDQKELLSQQANLTAAKETTNKLQEILRL